MANDGKQVSVGRFIIAALLLALIVRYALGYKAPHSPQGGHARHNHAAPEGGEREGVRTEQEQVSVFSTPHAVERALPFVEDDDDLTADEEVDRSEPSADGGSAGDGSVVAALSTPLVAVAPAPAQRGAGSVATQLEDQDDEVLRRKNGQARGNLLTALQQASQPDGSSDFISGVRSPQQSSGGTSGGTSGGAALAETSPSPTPVPTPPWVAGQARGYTMLYAMQPQARAVVEAHIQALEESRVREPYVGILVDGTFGEDFEYVKSITKRLSTDGRRLTLALYLANGSTMRNYDSTLIDALFSRIEPESFRYRIIEESDLRNRYAAVVEGARELFQYNKQMNPTNSNVAVVMLEDNLTIESYRSMREIVRERLDGMEVSIVRNPCVGCYSGNDGDSLGDPREEHSVDRFGLLRQDDGLSLDGTSFSYPGETSPGGLSSSALLQLMRDSAQRRLRYVGLWRFAWQGLVFGGPKPHPSQRTYIASTEEQRSFEIEALREGLSMEATVD